VTIAADPQVLVNPTYRASVTRRAIAAATGHLPAGLSHARLVTAATRQAHHLVAQVFDGLRLALAEAIQRGLVVPLVVAGVAVLAAALLTDRPMGTPPDTVA